MANTFFGLTIGTTGMHTANLGINTTAHNIANTETEGYSRQLIDIKADTPLRANGSYGMIGTGVSVISVAQQRDIYYDEKYRSNNTISGYYDSLDYYTKSIESYFNEIQLEGFNSNFNSFNNSLQELSKDPSSIAARTQTTNYAQSFCEYVNALDTSLSQLQENVNFEIKTMVDRINSYGVQIAGLTKQINSLEVTGEKANDIRDQRNLLIDELSNIVNISVSEKVVGDSGAGVTEYTVKIGDATLVDTYEWNSMEVYSRKDKISQSDIDGLYEIRWDNGQNFDGLHNGGRIQSLFEVRDGNSELGFAGKTSASIGDKIITVTDTTVNSIDKLHIAEQGLITINNKEYAYNGFKVTKDSEGNFEYEFALDDEITKDYDEAEITIGRSIAYKGLAYYKQQLDEFARVYSRRFNELHRQGVDLNNDPGMDYFNCKNPVSGENYVFEYSDDELADEIIVSSKTGEYAVPDEDKNYGSYYFMTAKGFCVSDEIRSDASKLAASTDVINGESNNDLTMKYIALKEDNMMFKQGKPSGFLQSLIAELGVDASKATSFSQNQSDIVSAIQNQRLSVSGVDIDEEAMNLVRYQNAYNLSAKVISTMNEIYDRLINYMGV